jgi:hypothetical protein
VAGTSIERLTERQRRIGLLSLGGAWLVVALAFANYGTGHSSQVYAPYVVAVAFGASGLLLWLFAFHPDSILLYGLAGAFTTAALLTQLVSSIAGALQSPDAATLAIAGSGGAFTAAMLGLFWWWWRTEVQIWLAYHKSRRTFHRGS